MRLRPAAASPGGLAVRQGELRGSHHHRSELDPPFHRGQLADGPHRELLLRHQGGLSLESVLLRRRCRRRRPEQALPRSDDRPEGGRRPTVASGGPMTSKPSHKETHVLKKMLAAALSLGLIGVTIPAPAHAGDDGISQGRIKHVLLISVDGLHALDVANYVAAQPDSALAELSERALTYSNARTPANSDSFPGLLALVTGGSPNSDDLFYDFRYNRSLFHPTDTSCSGQPGNTQVFG